MTEIKNMQTDDIQTAYEGSYYWIGGCGGDLQEWVTGYEGMLAEQEIGKPTKWFQTTGAALNLFAGDIPNPERDSFPWDMTCLMFPLDGLEVGRLAMFKMLMEDRWFDDVIEGMRSR